jgi:hypothetical protein
VCWKRRKLQSGIPPPTLPAGLLASRERFENFGVRADKGREDQVGMRDGPTLEDVRLRHSSAKQASTAVACTYVGNGGHRFITSARDCQRNSVTGDRKVDTLSRNIPYTLQEKKQDDCGFFPSSEVFRSAGCPHQRLSTSVLSHRRTSRRCAIVKALLLRGGVVGKFDDWPFAHASNSSQRNDPSHSQPITLPHISIFISTTMKYRHRLTKD